MNEIVAAINEAINLLRNISKQVSEAYNNKDFLISLINSTTNENRNLLWVSYQNATGPVKSIRKQVASILKDRDVTITEVEQIISTAKNENPNAYSTMYREWYNILYMFVLANFRSDLNNAVAGLISNIQTSLSNPSYLKNVRFDFSGERETGSTRLWVAFFNSKHEKQDTAKQLFLNVENGVVSYSLYDRPNDQHHDFVSIIDGQEFNATNLITHFSDHLEQIAGDNRADEIETIPLPANRRVFKVSMGPNEIDEETYQYMLERNLVMVHKDTKPLGQSYEKQGDIFTLKMSIGDYIYLCRGNKMVLIGEIAGDAQNVDYDGWGDDGWRQRSVKIVKPSAKEGKYGAEQKWWAPNFRSTCLEISKSELKLANEKLFIPFYKIEFVDQQRETTTDTRLDKSLPMSLNTILYGPPGTGKTYDTINYALAVIEKDQTLEKLKAESRNNRAEITDRFQKLLIKDWDNPEGQIGFITFHQSMSYEDFVEGIKPLKPVPGSTAVQYDIIPGIFKKICHLAAERRNVSNFDEVYDTFISDVTEVGKIELRTPVQNKPFDVHISSNKNCVSVPRTEASTEMTVTKEMIRDYITDGVIRDWKPYTVSISNYIRQKYSLNINEIDNSVKPFVLIIDEINRGNISQIFGELITLIEDGKRIGETEELSVTLPYSREVFSVPPNLYIIGTMNTADRSVEALDTALRRRFNFDWIPPDSGLLGQKQIGSINLKELLDIINERISYLLDDDHKIGHSYFLSVADIDSLRLVFSKSIIPLLKEYFYNDYGKIRMVLGDGFVTKKTGADSKPKFAVNDEGFIMEKTTYVINGIDKDFDIISALTKTLSNA